MSGRARLWLAVSAAAVALWPGQAAPDVMPFANPGWYTPVGVNLGGSLHHDLPGGFLLGAEGSIVNWNQIGDGAWIGGYADALWDFGPEQFRFSVGPEIGWGPFGVDVGYVGAVANDTYQHGIAGRLVFTLSLLAAYGRVGRVFDGSDDVYGEIGALIKLPLPLATESRRPYPPDVERAGEGDAGAPAAQVAVPDDGGSPAPKGVAVDPPPEPPGGFAQPP